MATVTEFTEDEVRALLRERCDEMHGNHRGQYPWLPAQRELAREIKVGVAKFAGFLCGSNLPPFAVCEYLGIERVVAYRDRATERLITLEEFVEQIRARTALKFKKDAAAEIGCSESVLSKTLDGTYNPSDHLANFFGYARIWAYLDRDPGRRAKQLTRATPAPARPPIPVKRTVFDPHGPIAFDAERSYSQEDVRALLFNKIRKDDLLIADVAHACGDDPCEIGEMDLGRKRASARVIEWLGLTPVNRRFAKDVERVRSLAQSSASSERIQLIAEDDVNAVAIDPATGRKLGCQEVRRRLLKKVGKRQYKDVEAEAGATQLSAIMTQSNRRPSAGFIEWLGLTPIRRRPTLRRTRAARGEVTFLSAEDEAEIIAKDAARSYCTREVRDLIRAKMGARTQVDVAREIGGSDCDLNGIVRGRAIASRKAILWLGLEPVKRVPRKFRVLVATDGAEEFTSAEVRERVAEKMGAMSRKEAARLMRVSLTEMGRALRTDGTGNVPGPKILAWVGLRPIPLRIVKYSRPHSHPEIQR
jgi:hypothetical protein